MERLCYDAKRAWSGNRSLVGLLLSSFHTGSYGCLWHCLYCIWGNEKPARLPPWAQIKFADNESCIAFISAAAVVLTPSSPTDGRFYFPRRRSNKTPLQHSPVSNNPRLACETTTRDGGAFVSSPALTAARTNGHVGLSELAEEPDEWEVNCNTKVNLDFEHITD